MVGCHEAPTIGSFMGRETMDQRLRWILQGVIAGGLTGAAIVALGFAASMLLDGGSLWQAAAAFCAVFMMPLCAGWAIGERLADHRAVECRRSAADEPSTSVAARESLAGDGLTLQRRRGPGAGGGIGPREG